MSEILPRFSQGQNVRYLGTGKVGTLNKVIKSSRSYQYKVTIDGQVRTVSERFLEPVVDVEENLVGDFQAGRFGGYEDYKVFQTWFRLSMPARDSGFDECFFRW